MTTEVAFETILDALLDGTRTFPARYLPRFSDLDRPSLRALTEDWPNVSLRRKVALLEDLQDLAEADTLVSFDDLARALLSDPDAPVRLGALGLLHECEDARLVAPCLDLLGKDENAEVRAAAAVALGEFVLLGELEKIPAETHHKVEEALLAASRDDDAFVRRRALEALGSSSREEVPPLIEAAFARKEPGWVVSALFAMGRSGDARWKTHILPKLSHADESIRVEAMQAAGELGLGAARPVLLDQLEEEEDPIVRHEIIWALSQIGGEGVRARLEELFETEQDDEEAEFLEEAIQNLAFTEDLGPFALFEIEHDGKEDE